MKPPVFLTGLILALTLTHPGARAQAPPADWIDAATGHRVIRLSGDDGGSSLYFHQNTYTPRGDKFVFDTRAGIAAVELTRLGKEPVKAEVVVPGAGAIATAWRAPDVYYTRSGALYATNLETKATRKVTAARGTVINADETLVVGAVYDAEAGAKVKELGSAAEIVPIAGVAAHKLCCERSHGRMRIGQGGSGGRLMWKHAD